MINKSTTTAIIAALAATACSTEDNTFYAEQSGVPVTLITNQSTGITKLLTDYDALLVPSNMNELSSNARKSKRLAISFATDPRKQTVEAGGTYNVTLATDAYSYQVIPTFPNKDTFGNTVSKDTLTSKNKAVNTIVENTAYAANGYLNFTTSFHYTYGDPVNCCLFYDSELDVDLANRTANVSIFFNPGDGNLSEATTAYLSFALPEDVYYMFSNVGGLSDDDKITLNVNIKTTDASKIAPISMLVKDLIIPTTAY